MLAIIAAIMCLGGAAVALYQAYIAWYKVDVFMERTRKWYSKYPGIFQKMLNEKYALWHTRIGAPIAVIIFVVYAYQLFLIGLGR